MINDLNNYNVYVCSDNRTRAYDKVTKKVTSYPRIIMENKLNRKLNINEDVHHVDGNPLNNNPNNLEVIKHGDHQSYHNKKYKDKYMICPLCGKNFLWTIKQQRTFYSNKSRNNPQRKNSKGPFCSKKCAGLGGIKK